MWSPEDGFVDSKRERPQYYPIVQLTENEQLPFVDWENLHSKVRQQCEKENLYFPLGVLRDKWMFPINSQDIKIATLFNDDEQIKWANLMFIIMDCAVFYVHTPTLWCLMNPVKESPKTVLTSDVILFYLIIIKVFSAMTLEKTLADTQRIQHIADTEMNPVSATQFENILGSGIFQPQNYFSENRDPRAPELLCREFVTYTLRVIEVLERQILRLSIIGFREKTSGQLGICTVLPPDPKLDEVRKYSATFWNNRLQMPDMRFSDDIHPTKVPVPTPERIATDEQSFHGVSLAACEALLWYIQSRHHSKAAFEVKE